MSFLTAKPSPVVSTLNHKILNMEHNPRKNVSGSEALPIEKGTLLEKEKG
jgi:hypothetical protein